MRKYTQNSLLLTTAIDYALDAQDENYLKNLRSQSTTTTTTKKPTTLYHKLLLLLL